jgi:transcriptional antiterminator/mannitol/fructose-specific phosphotransferase system IIA component (Ntr-type)
VDNVSINVEGGDKLDLNKRCKRIFDELLSNPNVTSAELEKKFHLTKRQLGYSIDKINEWLMTNHLPVIERTRQGNFVISQSVYTTFHSIENATLLFNPTRITEEQRISLIIMMLLGSEEELSLKYFSYYLNVSKNTILNDLKKVQRILCEYGLKVRYSRKKGYVLEGKEFQIRRLLIHRTSHLLQTNHGEDWLRKITGLQNSQLEEFEKRIEKVESKLNLKFTDEKLRMMPYILIFILRRIQRGNFIDPFSIAYEELSNTKEYQATEEILKGYQDIPETDRLFITLHLLSTNVFSSDFTPEESIPDLVQAIDKMLRQFEKSACIYLEDREQLIEQLLQHIKPAYYRIKYQLTDHFHFQGAFSKEFRELHHLVRQATTPLKELIGCEIPRNETAYIAMLIGGWMKKQGKSIDRKIKAVVVCPQGVSVSKLMFHELRELFPEIIFLDYLSVREFMNYSLDFDLVFSSVHLETDKKLFLTKAFLEKEEKQRLRKQVMLEIHGYIPNSIDLDRIMQIISDYATIHDKHSLKEELGKYIQRDENSAILIPSDDQLELNLNELLTPEMITLADSVESWEKAIQMGAEPLLKRRKIAPGYIDAINRYCKQDPYIVIGPDIAIPHAAPEDGVIDVGMSLLRVKDGVCYAQKYQIHLIIIIAAKDKHQHLHALMQLMKLAGSDEDRKRLIQADSVDQIYKIIRLYSAD